MIEKIENIIVDKYKQNKNRKKSMFVLSEPNEPAFPVTYLKTKGANLLYKFDDDPKLLHFIKDVPKAKCISDYVLFMEYKNMVYIYIIELSTTKFKTYQVEPTKNFINLILNISEKSLDFPKDKAIYKYILISKNGQKGCSKVKPSESYHLSAGSVIDIEKYCLIKQN